MGLTITIRLTKELAAWLEATAAKSGVSQGKVVRDELERARANLHAAGRIGAWSEESLDSRGIFPFVKGIADNGFLIAIRVGSD